MNLRLVTIIGVGGCAALLLFCLPRWYASRSFSVPHGGENARAIRRENRQTFEAEIKAHTLTNVDEKYRGAANAVETVLHSIGEDPREFRVQLEIQDEGGLYVFHLWHISAFKPEYENTIGNPGGRCCDIVYNSKTRKTSAPMYWQ